MRQPTRSTTVCFGSILTILAVCLGAVPALASTQGSFERTYQVSGPVDLEAMTRSGDITVRTGPAGTVTIRGKIQVGEGWFHSNWQGQVSEIEKNPPIHQDGNNIHIDNLDAHEISIDYDVTVPPETAVRSHSGSGDQRIEGLHGNLNLESGSGDMRLRAITGQIEVHTGSGDIEAHEVSGPFHAEAGSGDIRLEAKGSGDVRVHTGSGTIELRDINGTLQAESGSGDVSISGLQTGAWDVRTSSGNVDLDLPAQAAFELAASTGSGELVVGRQVTMVVQGEVREARHYIKGTVGGGGPQLTVHTSSGDVHIN